MTSGGPPMIRVSPERWAELNFDPQNLSTVRKWGREGFIFPPAISHGRSYYVEADARYLGRDHSRTK
jgi:predicted site-specific integrase-resolvase